MTAEQRVMNAIEFQKTDRIPLWSVHHFGKFNHQWRKYLNLEETVEPREYYGYDTSVYGADESYFPSEKQILSEDAEYTFENDGYGRILKRKKNGYFPKVLECRLKERRDIDKLKFETADPSVRYNGLDEYIRLDSDYCRFSRIGGLYIRSHSLWSEEKLLEDMILEPTFCDELLDKVTEHLTTMALETLKRTDTWKTGLFVYDDMASRYSPMFSPDLFGKYLLPRYKKIISECRKAGCRHFFFHSDGNIEPFMDLLIEAGFEGFNPLEPRSGLYLPRLRAKYGKKAVFFGGVCNTEILPGGDKKAIRNHIEPLIELALDGGVVLGMASAAEDISPEAYDYYMSLIRKLQQ